VGDSDRSRNFQYRRRARDFPSWSRDVRILAESGSRFLLGDVLKLGGTSLALVVIEIAMAIAFMTFLGRVFKLKPKLTSLLAVGSTVCGVSAIIATQGAIEADEEDSSFAIAAILALGALSLFTFPLIGHSLHLTDHAYSVWSGLAVDNTAEVLQQGRCTPTRQGNSLC
jgi:uncharacterized membrane protein YadS